MDIVISTILFNGQFWVALIEKASDDGNIFLGKHTFGPEPSNTDLIDFYLNTYVDIAVFQSDRRARIKKIRPDKERPAAVKKSFGEYKELQKKYLLEKKGLTNAEDRKQEEVKYLEKREKRKRKKWGH